MSDRVDMPVRQERIALDNAGKCPLGKEAELAADEVSEKIAGFH
ncbi:hypothetical protein [Methylobacterium brachythecii]|uniref:Uncharacterized protein n=1 Tax=Methylobacterium brachythecii TaxID=1176177 RepID=A0A7W6AKA7_9HYPH|nr:hypothetical protein [Methylobacterium brachythecii]MBB3902729.1 hypothetical protein [Methylobacterium brachythecii]